MKEIAEEVNKLAEEILIESSKFDKTLQSLGEVTRKESIEHGFNFMDYTSKIYAFRRFYPFCSSEHLSQNSKDFYNKTVSILEQAKNTLSNTAEMPKDLQDFLNQKK